jgi:hypothetical protein
LHLKPTFKTLFPLLTVLFVVTFIFFLNSLDSGSYKVDSKSEKVFSTIKDEDKIFVNVQLKEFDATSQTLKARLWVYPPEKYATALGSSVQVNYATSIGIDAATIDFKSDSNQGWWTEYQYLRAIDVELDVDNTVFSSRENDNWFPFDRYSIPIGGTITFWMKGSDTDDESDDVKESLPIQLNSYTANLSGWSSVMEMSAYEGNTVESQFRNGQYFLANIILERTSLNKILAILLGLIFFGGGLSMLLLFRSILMNHRPPTLSGLIWAGSTAFTMIQTRTVIPGAPRIGVKFDLFIFYPSLVMCFISGGLMFYHWISKETWSREL